MYVYSTVPTAFLNAHFGMGDGPYYLVNVQCDGYETSLLDCLTSTFGEHHCTPGMDAGVSCKGKNEVDITMVQLENSTFY